VDEWEQIQAVFDYWKEHLGSPRHKLTEERLGFCLGRLRNGFTVSDLQRVIDVVKVTPFWLGQNNRNRVYTDFQYIFRNQTRVEKFLVGVENPRSSEALYADDTRSEPDQVEI